MHGLMTMNRAVVTHATSQNQQFVTGTLNHVLDNHTVIKQFFIVEISRTSTNIMENLSVPCVFVGPACFQESPRPLRLSIYITAVFCIFEVCKYYSLLSF
jgi:hypothetical protein